MITVTTVTKKAITSKTCESFAQALAAVQNAHSKGECRVFMRGKPNR